MNPRLAIPEKARLPITWAVRILVGALFVFSGFTKGVDPWGTIYKFKEYFGVWGYEIWDGLNLAGVFALCLAEFLIGFFLLFGCFRRATPILALLVMAFMLPLTLWLAIANPISDCGCFGDALKLSNWATFIKNIVLTLGAVWLVVFNIKAPALIKPYLQWIAAIAAGAYILTVSSVGYVYQPLIDFRQYKIGTPLVEEDAETSYSDDTDSALRFVYEKEGERKEFTIDEELPDEADGWTFVERYYAEPETSAEDSPVPSPKVETGEKHLRFFSEDGLDDMTDEVIGNGRQLILMMPSLSEISAAKTWKINSFNQWCEDNDIEMLATVGGNPAEIERWKDISLADYPIYTSDDTSIKEVVRGNPAVVYIEDGIIKWKSALGAISIDDFQDPEVSSNPMSFARNDSRILWSMTLVFLAVTILLVLLSYSPNLFKLPSRKSGNSGNSKKSEKPDKENEES